MKPEDRTRLEARLVDMRGVLGAEDFAALLSATCASLRELVERPNGAPWSDAEVQAGIDIAMLLGHEGVEEACRAIRGEPLIDGAADAARDGLAEVFIYLGGRRKA